VPGSAYHESSLSLGLGIRQKPPNQYYVEGRPCSANECCPGTASGTLGSPVDRELQAPSGQRFRRAGASSRLQRVSDKCRARCSAASAYSLLTTESSYATVGLAAAPAASLGQVSVHSLLAGELTGGRCYCSLTDQEHSTHRNSGYQPPPPPPPSIFFSFSFLLLGLPLDGASLAN
jgi:hypothetical protein